MFSCWVARCATEVRSAVSNCSKPQVPRLSHIYVFASCFATHICMHNSSTRYRLALFRPRIEGFLKLGISHRQNTMLLMMLNVCNRTQSANTATLVRVRCQRLHVLMLEGGFLGKHSKDYDLFFSKPVCACTSLGRSRNMWGATIWHKKTRHVFAFHTNACVTIIAACA